MTTTDDEVLKRDILGFLNQFPPIGPNQGTYRTNILERAFETTIALTKLERLIENLEKKGYVYTNEEQDGFREVLTEEGKEELIKLEKEYGEYITPSARARERSLNQATRRVNSFDDKGLKIFEETMIEAKKVFNLNLKMSSIIFGIGVVLLGISIIIIIIPDATPYQQLFGSGSSLAGLVTIMSQFYYGPSERINRAVTNLVQIEIAFLSFIRQVTQITAMFEREYLEDDFNIEDLKKLLDSIERTLTKTMPLVDKYTISHTSSSQDVKGKKSEE